MYWDQVKSTKKALKKLPVSAKAVLVSEDGKVLVMRKYNGIVDLPGGKVEEGENLYDALTREIDEEVGITVTKFEFLSSWIKHSPVLGDRLIVVFEARLNRKAKKINIKLSAEHVWGKFMYWEEAEELAHMTLGYANAIEICCSKYKPVN